MRLSDGAYHFVGLLDGKRTVAEAWELVGGQMDDAAPTQPEVIQILSQLHSANLVEADISPDAAGAAPPAQGDAAAAVAAACDEHPVPPHSAAFDLNGIVTRWMPVAWAGSQHRGHVIWLVVVIVGSGGAGARLAGPLTDQSASALDYTNWVCLWRCSSSPR